MTHAKRGRTDHARRARSWRSGFERLESRALLAGLDPTFGTGGLVTADFGGNESQASAVAIQPDGKIIAVGGALKTTRDSDFTIARFNTDGSLDTSFGGGTGLVVTAFDLGTTFKSDRATGVALQPDGKIVVVGIAGTGGFGIFGNAGEIGIVRLNPDGTPDTSFDDDGRLVLPQTSTSSAAVAIQTAGLTGGAKFRIVVTGRSGGLGTNSGGVLVARLDPAGILDPTFGTAGIAAADFQDPAATGGGFGGLIADSTPSAIVVQPDGGIVVAGKARAVTGDFGVLRLTTDGKLDPTFDGDGRTVIDLGGDDIPTSMALTADGSLVVAGSSGGRMVLAKLTKNGALDTTFSGDGMVAIETVKEGLGVAFDPTTGKIVAAGWSVLPDPSVEDFAVVRLNPDGQLDTSFGGGIQTVGFDLDSTAPRFFFERDNDRAQAVAIQPDGKIVAVGYATIQPSFTKTTNFALVRLLSSAAGTTTTTTTTPTTTTPTTTTPTTTTPTTTTPTDTTPPVKVPLPGTTTPTTTTTTTPTTSPRAGLAKGGGGGSGGGASRGRSSLPGGPARGRTSTAGGGSRGRSSKTGGGANGRGPRTTPTTSTSPKTSDVPPRVVKVTPIRKGRGPVSGLRITFSAPIERTGASNSSAFQVALAGADGRFGTADDVAVTISRAVPQGVGKSVVLRFAGGLDRGSLGGLRIASGALVGTNGLALDGDTDGAAGGDFQRTFSA